MTTNPMFDPGRLTSAQRDGLACVRCGADHTTTDVPAVPVGTAGGVQVFACAPCADPDPDVQTVMRELRGLAERTADRHGENAAKALVRVFMAFLRDQIGERETLALGRAAARGQWQGVVARLVKLGAWEQNGAAR